MYTTLQTGDGSDPGTEPESSSFGQCVWLTEQQIDTLMTDARIVESANVAPHRSKRTLTNFKTYPLNKWSMPVHYKFDGTHGNSNQYIPLHLIFLIPLPLLEM